MQISLGFLSGSAVKKKICLLVQEAQKMQVWSPGQEDPLKKETATHSSILAWKIPWAEEPGGLQSERVAKSWTGTIFFLSSGLSHVLSFISFYFPQTQPSCISLGSWDGGVTCVLPPSFVHPSLCTWLCSLLLASSPVYPLTLPPQEEWEKPPRAPWHFVRTVSPLSAWSSGLCIFSPKMTAFSGAQRMFFSAITRTQHVLQILQKWIFGTLWTCLGVRWEGRRSKNRDRT